MSSSRYVMGELAPSDSYSDRPPRRRRRWLRVLLIVFMVMALSFGSCVAVGIYGLRKSQGPELQENSSLQLTLKGEIPEFGSAGVEQLLAGGSPMSVDRFRRLLEKAGKDPKIDSVTLVVDSLSVGFGTIEALRELMQDFRAQGKALRVLIEADVAGEAELYLASAGSEVLLSPHTMVSFDGLAYDITFFGGSLEKLGLKSDVLQFKEYKSALEPMTRKEMSEPMKRSMQALLDGTWRHLLDGISKDRKIERAALENLAELGFTTAQAAKELGLVDALGYRDQLLAQVQGEMVSPSKYLRNSGWGLPAAEEGEHKRIALIAATGGIVVDGSASFSAQETMSGRKVAAALRKAAKDESISAILLRVNSPGGSMVGSDLVWREIQRAREEFKKPVVISMGNMAASGGYWISMGADAIVASPSTITGSIGVIFGRMSFGDFLQSLGMSHDSVSAGGKNANMNSLWDPLKPEQLELFRGVLNQGYDTFVKKVASGRNRPVAEIEAVAKGRVWTGEDALKHGLVDRLGGILTAVTLCKEKLGLPEDAQVELQSYPEQKLWESFFEADIWSQASVFFGENPSGRILGKLKQQAKAEASPRVWVLAPSVGLR